MISSSELEMAVNSTYSSIISEIQLSNLNFSIQMTPYASYITLKKSVQKDLHGVPATLSPPLIVLLQEAQKQIIFLQNENTKLKSNADILEIKIEAVAGENKRLVNSLEETSKAGNILHAKLEVAEKEITTLKSEKAENEYKIKEIKKKHSEEVNKLQVKVKDLEIKTKTNAKEIHDLKRSLDSTRATLKTCKTEKSSLKTSKTKLESNIRKLEQEKLKLIKGSNLKAVKSENLDVNSNSLMLPSSHFSSHSFIPSMTSHWNPHSIKPFYSPSDLSSMVTHCAVLPPPRSSPLSISEVLEALNKAVEKLNASTKWIDSFKNQ